MISEEVTCDDVQVTGNESPAVRQAISEEVTCDTLHHFVSYGMEVMHNGCLVIYEKGIGDDSLVVAYAIHCDFPHCAEGGILDIAPS